MAIEDHDAIRQEFNSCVNMTPAELERWLGSEQSQSVGDSHAPGGDGGESTGHEMGGRIAELLRAKKGDLTDEDYAAMNKVIGYIHRHSAQHPGGDITDSKWRYSLMNWGHDPCKD